MSDASMNMNSTTALTVRDPWAMVPSLGNLDAYISAANRLPRTSRVRTTRAMERR